MTKVEINEFRLDAIEKQLETLWKEVDKMKTETTNLRIATAKSSVITGLVQSIGTVLIIWLFRNALFG